MGVPKQKWTAEEEAALKAGVRKHGAGKWRTILTDPEFCQVLRLRSNVDLKDKWRNISVIANGLGPRSKARLAIRKNQSVSRYENDLMALTSVPHAEEANPFSPYVGALWNSGPNESLPRLDNHILEAIIRSEGPNGCDKSEIAMYIEEQYWSPPDLKRALSAKLKEMVGTGQLIKEKRKYRITPAGTISGVTSPLLILGGKQQDSSEKTDIDLSKMRSINAEEAAAAAARAVKEAEDAIAVAEKAGRELQRAEAEAEAAQVFAKAALRALQSTANYMW